MTRHCVGKPFRRQLPSTSRPRQIATTIGASAPRGHLVDSGPAHGYRPEVWAARFVAVTLLFLLGATPATGYSGPMISDWQNLREFTDLAVIGRLVRVEPGFPLKYGGTLRATVAVERVLASSVPAVPETVSLWLMYGPEQSFDAEIGPRRTQLPEGRGIFFLRRADPDFVARYPGFAEGFVLLIGGSGALLIDRDRVRVVERALIHANFAPLFHELDGKHVDEVVEAIHDALPSTSTLAQPARQLPSRAPSVLPLVFLAALALAENLVRRSRERAAQDWRIRRPALGWRVRGA